MASLRGTIRTLLSGVVVGVVAAAANYGLVYLLVTVDGAGRTVRTWQAAGWAFFNAHFVDTVVTTTGGGTGRRSINYLLASEPAAGSGSPATSTVPAVAYFLVPVVVLLVAGYLHYRLSGTSPSTLGTAVVGGTVVAGYGPLAVTLLFLLAIGSPAVLAGGYVGPDTTTGILLAGLAYPVALGAIGGVIAGRGES